MFPRRPFAHLYFVDERLAEELQVVLLDVFKIDLRARDEGPDQAFLVGSETLKIEQAPHTLHKKERARKFRVRVP